MLAALRGWDYQKRNFCTCTSRTTCPGYHSQHSWRRKVDWFSRWWQLKYFLFSTLPGEMIQFDSYFSKGLKPPTRFFLDDEDMQLLMGVRLTGWLVFQHPGVFFFLWLFDGEKRLIVIGETQGGEIFCKMPFRWLKHLLRRHGRKANAFCLPDVYVSMDILGLSFVPLGRQSKQQYLSTWKDHN